MNGWTALALGLALYGIYLAQRQLAVETPTNPAAAAARRELAAILGAAETDVEVARVTPETWPDTSLGLPEPGFGYAQVVTPGYRVELRAGGRHWEFHATADGTRVRLCEPCSARLSGG
jgi:hypothetical protein